MDAKSRAGLKLLARAGAIGDRAELQFHILNRTLLAATYDRASLWRFGGRPRLLGVSGTEREDPNGPFAKSWRALLAAAKAGSGAQRWSTADASATAPLLAAIAPTAEALWLPLPGTNVALAAERWNRGFSQADAELLTDIVAGYAPAWRMRGGTAPGATRRWLGAALLLAAVAAAMIFVRLPLRIVAPCEVVPGAPFLVATPMDGVIREVTVKPGQEVRTGEVLAEYEQGVEERDLEVARRQVEAAEAELISLRTQSLSEPHLRSRVLILEARLEQERARLALSEERWGRMRIVAPFDGLARFEDPDAWRGKPVSVGERLMWLVEPGRNHVRIWLPQNDRVEFDFNHPVRVHLDAYGGEPFSARLTRVGTTTRVSPTRAYAFPADAEWMEGVAADPLLGLSGTAILYGEKVPLGWWLLRKPLGEMRKWLGI